MAVNIGPKIGIDGEKQFREQITHLNTQIKSFGAELKAVSSVMTTEENAMQKNIKAHELLTKQYAASKAEYEAINKAIEKASKEYGENSNQVLKLKTAAANAQTQMNKLQAELSKNNDEYIELSKTSDKAGKAIKDSGKDAATAHEKWSKLANGLKAAGAAVGSIAVAAGAAAVSLGKEVVRSFGELEQNLGGAEAVFGDFADAIVNESEDAYKAMGTTQSDYLATANKMGALFQGTGVEQERSLELTTKAMQRAADMASVMGISTEDALEAITGAAKGNYTMMDNLGVAMNNTALDAYAAAQGFETAFSKMDGAQKAEIAMQYFFEKTAQYAGNFEREATQTISGSIGLLSASFQSFIAGLGNSQANIQNLTTNMISAFQAVMENLTPVIENIITALPQATGAIIDALGGMLPSILQLVTEIFGQVFETIIALLPELAPVITEMLVSITNLIVQNLPLLLQAAVQIVATLASGIGESLPELIPATVEAIVAIVDGLIDNMPLLIDAALQLVTGLAEGLIAAIPQLINAVPELIYSIIQAIINSLPSIIASAGEIMTALVMGLLQSIPLLVASIPQIINAIIGAFKNTDWKKVGKNILEGIANGIKNGATTIANAARSAANKALEAAKKFLGIHSPSTVFRDEIGKNMMLGMAGGLTKYTGLAETAAKRASGIVAGAFGTETAVPRFANGTATAYDRMAASMGNLRVVLNDGTLVGKIAPRMDQTLGGYTKVKARYGV